MQTREAIEGGSIARVRFRNNAAGCPSEELLLQWEAVSQLLPAKQAVVKDVFESLIIKYQTRRWDAARLAAKVPSTAAKKAVAALEKNGAQAKSAAASVHR